MARVTESSRLYVGMTTETVGVVGWATDDSSWSWTKRYESLPIRDDSSVPVLLSDVLASETFNERH